MQVILATDYAIRSLLYLALAGRMAPASEVSEKMGIPKQYLVTMSKKLKQAGILDSAPGMAGGYFLARPAEKITLLDIVRVTEGTSNLNRCAEHSQYCQFFATEACPVSDVYRELQTSVEGLLGGVTLASLRDKLQKKEGEF